MDHAYRCGTSNNLNNSIFYVSSFSLRTSEPFKQQRSRWPLSEEGQSERLGRIWHHWQQDGPLSLWPVVMLAEWRTSSWCLCGCLLYHTLLCVKSRPVLKHTLAFFGISFVLLKFQRMAQAFFLLVRSPLINCSTDLGCGSGEDQTENNNDTNSGI